MRLFLVIVLLMTVMVACNTKENKTTSTVDVTDSQSTNVDTTERNVYTNDRFHDVTAKRLGGNKFHVLGTAQVFEAAFSWVVEDGHNELAQGHEMTDAGAPAWGHFDFTIDVAKQQDNSTLHLILFESSPKDGSRQHELAIPLY